MKNTKEIRAILGVLFYLNRLGYNDRDIANVLEYAFYRLFGSNTNLLLLACIGQTKESAKPAIDEILRTQTDFNEFMNGKEKH